MYVYIHPSWTRLSFGFCQMLAQWSRGSGFGSHERDRGCALLSLVYSILIYRSDVNFIDRADAYAYNTIWKFQNFNDNLIHF